MDKRENLTRLTVTTEPSLLARVQQHRCELSQRTGLRLSTSATVSALLRAGLEATDKPQHR